MKKSGAIQPESGEKAAGEGMKKYKIKYIEREIFT